MSALEEQFAQQIKAYSLPGMMREYRFDVSRRWRFDFAFPLQRVALEIEGGIWCGGRHTRGLGFEADVEKYNQATLLGWRVFKATGRMVKRGEAIQLLKQALEER